MGQSADQTVRQIEDTRDRLGTELRELEDRVSDRVSTGRRAVVPIAGAVAATGAAWLVVRGLRKRARASARKNVIRRIVPGRLGKSLSQTLENEPWKLWVTAAGGVWVTVRLAELRQLRRLNRTLVVR